LLIPKIFIEIRENKKAIPVMKVGVSEDGSLLGKAAM
jgi:hypothetical protein